MDNIVIVGTNEYAEYVFEAIRKDKVADVVAFATLKAFQTQTEYRGLPVYAVEDLPDYLDMNDCQVLICVGYTEMNARRERTYSLCKQLNYRIFTYISPRAYIDCEPENIGEGCIIMPRAVISPCTKIGICNVINSGSGVGHTSTVGNFNWFSGRVVTAGDVTIGNRCFFGINSVICNNVKIADETLIGVCSYVTKDTKSGLAYMGMPAKNKKNMKSKIVIDFV